jgi:hypothetical protein
LFAHFRKDSHNCKSLQNKELVSFEISSVPLWESRWNERSWRDFLQSVPKSLPCNHLRFLIQFGTLIALRNGVNTEMNVTEASGSPAMVGLGSAILDSSGVQSMRHNLHELANVFTGVMIAGGLLSQHLRAGSLQHYASSICESSERGSDLVREIRSQLMAACDEVGAPNGDSVNLT